MNTKNISTTYIFDEEKICDDCRSLLKKDRFRPVHKNLILNNVINNKMITGQEDEFYYSCRVCSTTWRHETGKGGFGWQLTKIDS
ncbi:hypothetical protein [uncultured Chryseobacterium sp.]|uniref:hypothetical protein n=1 Tax=uncultured Chryseobacterium sp. TaxID=259322 RepID=UPI003747B583